MIRNKLIYIVLLLVGMLSVDHAACGQSGSILGHQQDLPGYYNPALAKNNKYSEVAVVYRSQWSELGYPSVSTLYFRQPLKTEMSFLNFRSVGLILQNENFQLIDRNSVTFFSSNTVFEEKDVAVTLGFGAQLQMQGVNHSELTQKELMDPEVRGLSNSFQVIPHFGLGAEVKGTRVGVSLDMTADDPFHTLLGYAEKRLRVKSAKLMLIPSVLYRYSPTGQSQFESQFRTVYDRKVALTLGYRQDFGPVAQLGFLLGAFKASYGAEVPSKGRNALGYTQEFLASYQFEFTHKKQHKRDSVLKHQRDSINQVRLQQLKQARLENLKKKKEIAKLSSDSVAADSTQNQQVAEKRIDPKNLKKVTEDDVIDFGDMPLHLKEKVTHVVLRDIRFETDYDILKPYAYKELDKLSAFMHHHHHFFVEIQGHTDDVGTAEDNYDLSRRRALIVFNYLVHKGIDEDRMSIVGYGEDKPLVENTSDEARSYNRRIEVVFIRSDE